MAGVASAAAAIIAAETSLRMVIRFLHVELTSQRCWLLHADGEGIRRLKEQFLTSIQPPARWAPSQSRTPVIADEVRLLPRRNRAGARLDAETRALDKRDDRVHPNSGRSA